MRKEEQKLIGLKTVGGGRRIHFPEHGSEFDDHFFQELPLLRGESLLVINGRTDHAVFVADLFAGGAFAVFTAEVPVAVFVPVGALGEQGVAIELTAELVGVGDTTVRQSSCPLKSSATVLLPAIEYSRPFASIAPGRGGEDTDHFTVPKGLCAEKPVPVIKYSLSSGPTIGTWPRGNVRSSAPSFTTYTTFDDPPAE